MRALVTTPGDGARLLELAAPVPLADEVLVAPVLVGLCGTDLELIDGILDPAYVTYPLILGHEWVGRLVEDVSGVGPAATAVVVEGIVPCTECGACRRGDTNRCATYDEVGFTRPGAAAELIAVPARLVHALAPAVSLDDAVLVEPMAVVWRALTRLPLVEDASVAIVGDGTIALLAAHLVRLMHPRRVVVVGRRVEQAELARAAGADEFTTAEPSERFDLVIEAAGSAAAVTSALALAERGAQVIVLGLAPHGERVAVEPDALVNNDLVVQGSFSYTQRAWREVVARLNEGSLRPSFLITHRVALADSAAALAALRGHDPRPGPRGKVVLDLR